MARPKILLIDDDQDIENTFKMALNPLVELNYASTINEAKNKLRTNSYTLIIIDLNLADENGLNFADQLKSDFAINSQQIIMITGEGSIDDEILGHQLGVRDYLKKPLNLKLLRTVLDKHIASILDTPQNAIRVGPFFLDLIKHRASLEHKEQTRPIDLTQKEFEILRLFLENKGQVFSRDNIFEKIWNEESDSLSRTVDMHISSIRKKIGSYSNSIKNKRGVGYYFEL